MSDIVDQGYVRIQTILSDMIRGCAIIRWLAVIVLTVTIGSVGSAMAEEPQQASNARNNLLNGGFEDGLDGWQVFPGSARGEVEAQQAHSGKSSLKLTNAPGVTSRAWQIIQVNEDGPFTINFSCQMRRDMKDPIAKVGIDFVVISPDGTTKVYFWEISGGVDEWASNVKDSFKVEGPIESVEVYLLIYCADDIYPEGTKELAEQETAWFDDVFVEIEKEGSEAQEK